MTDPGQGTKKVGSRPFGKHAGCDCEQRKHVKKKNHTLQTFCSFTSNLEGCFRASADFVVANVFEHTLGCAYLETKTNNYYRDSYV